MGQSPQHEGSRELEGAKTFDPEVTLVDERRSSLTAGATLTHDNSTTSPRSMRKGRETCAHGWPPTFASAQPLSGGHQVKHSNDAEQIAPSVARGMAGRMHERKNMPPPSGATLLLQASSNRANPPQGVAIP